MTTQETLRRYRAPVVAINSMRTSGPALNAIDGSRQGPYGRPARRARKRLASLSWFMKYLNEPIAPQAKKKLRPMALTSGNDKSPGTPYHCASLGIRPPTASKELK